MKRFMLVLVSLVWNCGLANANVSSGQMAPDFALTDINGNPQKLSAYKGKYVVLEWFNSECPFVQKHYESGNMQSLQKKFGGQGVVWLTINSTNPNSSNYRDPARSREIAKSWKLYSAALMLDTDGKVGRMFGATATPHMWVIEPSGKVIYAGAIDNKASFRQDDVKTAKNFVASALEDSMAGRPIGVAAAPAYGCSIKY
ncbi:MAG: thioredoxin family protein [Burkholderiales bacterium]